MSVEHERSRAEAIAASSTIAELLVNVIKSGGLKDSNGSEINLSQILDGFNSVGSSPFLSMLDVQKFDQFVLCDAPVTDGSKSKLKALYRNELGKKRDKAMREDFNRWLIINHDIDKNRLPDI